jgi:hypothetical protein
MSGASRGDDILIAFSGLSAAEAAELARDLEQALIADGVRAEALKVARTDAEAMDFGGTLVCLGGALAWEFLKAGAESAGQAAGKAAGRDAYGYVRRKLDDFCRRRRVAAELTVPGGRTWVLGSEFERASETDAAAALGGAVGTLGVVLLGASRFPHLDGLDNAAFARSAAAVRALFARPGPVFARTALLDLFDAALRPDEIVEAIDRHIGAHPDLTDLVLYYCGHGSFLRDRTYFLTLRNTVAGREASTGLKLKDLRHDLEARLASRRLYLLLDCCFAGAAVKEFMGPNVERVVETAVVDALPPGGWVVLAAAPASLPAMAPAGQDLTMFTGALVEVLDRAGRPLSFDDIAAETRRAVQIAHGARAVIPECHAPRQAGGDLRRVPLFGGWPAVSADPDDADGLFARAARLGPSAPDEAAPLYRRAAEGGHAGAQVALGACYEHGRGVEQDPAEAARFYRLAAEQGHARGQWALGVCYDNGIGVPEDPAEAVRLFRMAAAGGDADAQLNLGLCYETGIGAEKDPFEAARLFRLAAEQGNVDGQYHYGACFEAGTGGVPQDDAAAARLYALASAQGDSFARSALARVLARNPGLKLP